MHAHYIEEDIFEGCIFIFSACSFAQFLQRALSTERLIDDTNAGAESTTS
jgi:hypothetical protein